MKIIKLLLLPLILFSTAVQAQEISYMGIIGRGQALGAKDQYDNVVPVLGINSSGNTFIGARTGGALAFGNTAITGTLSVSGDITLTGANARVIPGTSSLSVRNNANSASNLQIVDSGEITVRNDIAYNDSAFFVYPTTADAADSSAVQILGGGSALATRGATILVAGNENASTGAINLSAGAVATGNISFSINHASALFRFFNASGNRTLYHDNSGNLTLDATNGGDLILSKSGSAISIQENSASTACMGTSAPNGTTPVVVTTSCATSGARVFYSRNGAVTNNASISTTTAPNGTSFSFASTNGSDTGGASVVWLIVKESA